MARSLRACALLAAWVAAALVGCGDSHSGAPPIDAAVAGTGGTGSAATGGAGGAGGAGGTGGAGSGATGGAGGTGGGGTADAAMTTDASVSDGAVSDAAVDAADVVSCDRRTLTCRVAEPACADGEVPRILGNCFGECVRIDACVCSEAAECPFEEMYTCHRFRQRCGPYVN